MSLKGKTLFISGGSRGIGLAIAVRAAQDGANVVIAAKTADPHPKLPGTIHTAVEEIDKAGGKGPANWDELVALLDKFKEQGITPVAHGGQPWQDATIFDAVVMSTGGPDFYKKAFIDLDPEALGSDTMKQAFERMTVIRGFVDDNFSGRDWNLASAMGDCQEFRVWTDG